MNQQVDWAIQKKEDVTSANISDLDFAIIMGVFHVKKEIEVFVAESLSGELSPIQMEIIAKLYIKDCKTSTELSHKLRVSKANLSGVIKRLVGKGLLTKEVDEHDARSNILRLTRKGKKIAETKIPDFFGMIGSALSSMSKKEKEYFRNGLIKLFLELEKRNS
jgi:MarR family transcriptional regulator, 2-MHQ and catechol-resistance regulon repressor